MTELYAFVGNVLVLDLKVVLWPARRYESLPNEFTWMLWAQGCSHILMIIAYLGSLNDTEQRKKGQNW